MTYKNPIAAVSGALTFPSIHSPDYVTSGGATGWSINRDGTATFNTTGGSFQITANGLFFYVPSAGSGTLIASFANTAGTDQYGNQYDAGFFLNQKQAHLTGDQSDTVMINPNGALGPEILFAEAGHGFASHLIQFNNELRAEAANASGALFRMNMPFLATGGYEGQAKFQGAEVTYPVSSAAFTDYSQAKWDPPVILCPPSETIELILWFMGHASTNTANQTITLAARIKQGSTVLFAPTGVMSGAMNQSDGANATTNDVLTAVHHTVGRDILGGMSGLPITFVPTVRITSNAAPNPHIASACIGVKPSVYSQLESTFN